MTTTTKAMTETIANRLIELGCGSDAATEYAAAMLNALSSCSPTGIAPATRLILSPDMPDAEIVRKFGDLNERELGLVRASIWWANHTRMLDPSHWPAIDRLKGEKELTDFRGDV